MIKIDKANKLVSKISLASVIALLGAIFIYITIFTLCAFLKYRSFSFHDIDLAIINQTFWNTVHGSLVVENIGSATIFNGGHVFIIIIVLSPIYYLFQSPLTLLVLQTIALGSGALPLYLIADKLLNGRCALVISLSYLIYPALSYVNLYEFHPIAFSVPALFWMFFFYLDRNWLIFLILMFLALFIREDVTIPVAAFGVFAFLEKIFHSQSNGKSELKWAIVPFFTAVIWLFLCTRYIQPHYRLPELNIGARSAGMLGYYSWLKGPILESVYSLFFQSRLGILRTLKLNYLFQLFFPLGFLSIFYPAALIMVLICLIEGMFSSRITHFSIHYQYSSIIIPAIYISAIYGIRSLLSWKIFSLKSRWLLIIIVLCSVISAYFWGPLFEIPQRIALWKMTEEDEIRDRLIREIPPEAPVVGTFEFTPKLSNRSRLFYFYHIYASSLNPQFIPNLRASQEFATWALIDFDDWLTFYDFYTPGGYESVFHFLMNGKWELITTVNSLALFKKGKQADLGIVEEINFTDKTQFRDIPGIPELKFAGINLEQKKYFGKTILRLEVNIKCQNKLTDNILILARFIDRTDLTKGFQQFFFAPYRIYPTSLWQPEEIIKQRCDILVPREQPEGNYDLFLFALRKQSKLNFSQQARRLFYSYYDTAMALKLLPKQWGIPPDQLLEQVIISKISNALAL